MGLSIGNNCVRLASVRDLLLATPKRCHIVLAQELENSASACELIVC